MKLAVVGSRSIVDKKIFEILDKHKSEIDEIVSGGAIGVDTMAKVWAEVNEKKYKEFLPDWKNFGKSAGFIRNKEIVNYCDKLVAFWDGKSKGTKNSIDLAKEQNKLLKVFYFDE